MVLCSQSRSSDLEDVGIWNKTDYFVQTNTTQAITTATPKWRPIKALLRHPTFKVDLADFCPYLKGDVALIHLSQPLKLDGKFVTKIKLADKFTLKPGDPLRISGYGETEFGRAKSLRYTDLRYVDPVECNQTYGGIIDRSHLCVDWGKAWRSVYYGDSGSPLTANGYLYGMTAFMCPDFTTLNPRPSVFVNITNFHGWIKEQLEKAGDKLLI